MPKQDDKFYLGHRERLKDKFLDNKLTEYEQLELLLSFAIPRRDVKPLSRKLIEQFGSVYYVIIAEYDDLIHYDLVEFKIETNINDYSRFVMISSFIEIIYYFIVDQIKENIDKYTFLIEKSNRNEINGIIKCNFNIGVILINYLLIKRRYKREKTS